GGFGSRFRQEGIWDRDLEKSIRLEEDAMESEPQGADGLYPRTRRRRLRARWWPSQLVRKCRRVSGAPLGRGSLAVSLRFPSCTVGTRTVTLASQDRPGLSRGSTP
uniref:Uncharacterized protein n=1 Tax=Rhinopithecus bieti TaxID=61621 RepID=A0A2K6L4D0_RHIBE